MGIVLKLPSLEPQWVELFNGAAVLCKPVTAMAVQIARAQAAALLVDLVAGGEAVTKLGGHVDGMPDLNDPDMLDATRQSLVLLSLAEQVISDWRGVLDEGGKALAFDGSLLPLLLSDRRLAERFGHFAMAPLLEVSEEGED